MAKALLGAVLKEDTSISISAILLIKVKVATYHCGCIRKQCQTQNTQIKPLVMQNFLVPAFDRCSIDAVLIYMSTMSYK